MSVKLLEQLARRHKCEAVPRTRWKAEALTTAKAGEEYCQLSKTLNVCRLSRNALPSSFYLKGKAPIHSQIVQFSVNGRHFVLIILEAGQATS